MKITLVLLILWLILGFMQAMPSSSPCSNGGSDSGLGFFEPHRSWCWLRGGPTGSLAVLPWIIVQAVPAHCHRGEQQQPLKGEEQISSYSYVVDDRRHRRVVAPLVDQLPVPHAVTVATGLTSRHSPHTTMTLPTATVHYLPGPRRARNGISSTSENGIGRSSGSPLARTREIRAMDWGRKRLTRRIIWTWDLRSIGSTGRKSIGISLLPKNKTPNY